MLCHLYFLNFFWCQTCGTQTFEKRYAKIPVFDPVSSQLWQTWTFWMFIKGLFEGGGSRYETGV